MKFAEVVRSPINASEACPEITPVPKAVVREESKNADAYESTQTPRAASPIPGPAAQPRPPRGNCFRIPSGPRNGVTGLHAALLFTALGAGGVTMVAYGATHHGLALKALGGAVIGIAVFGGLLYTCEAVERRRHLRDLDYVRQWQAQHASWGQV